MREKILLGALLAVLISSFMISQGASAEVTSTSVDPLTTVKPAGETFFVTLDVANVQGLWGYQYAIHYNSTVLTAINFTNQADLIYPTFTTEEPSEINNTAGIVRASYHAGFGDHVGITTAESKPLLQIAFSINMNGSSTIAIDADETRFVDVTGTGMIPGVNLKTSNGFFSTQEIKLHDIAVTGVTVSPTTAKPGDTISIDVAFKNNGDFIENFTITVSHNTTTGAYDTIQTKAVTNMAIGASDTLSFSWDTTGLGAQEFFVRAQAVVANEDHPIDNVFDSEVISLTGAGSSGLIRTITYIVAALVVVIVVVVVIILLRRRK